MKKEEINESLIGKRVKGIFIGIEVTGTIIGIVEDLTFPWKPKSDDNKVCTKGVRIRLDNPIQYGDDLYTEYESTARVFDAWGNLQHTELLDVPTSVNIEESYLEESYLEEAYHEFTASGGCRD